MPSGNLPTEIKQDLTVEFFNNFFEIRRTTSSNINGAVLAYFQSITNDQESAEILADVVISTALKENLDPMAVINELQSLSKKTRSSAPIDTPVLIVEEQANDLYAKPGPVGRDNNYSELDAFLTMFLNLNRVNTSLLGISNDPQQGKYVRRTILP